MTDDEPVQAFLARMRNFDRYWVPDANGDAVETDWMTWAIWSTQRGETRSHIVAEDRDEAPGAPSVHVSTVFLGLDHSYRLDAPPVLWETMVFGGPLDGEMTRYTSRPAAIAGHHEMCRRVSAAMALQDGQGGC